MAATVYINGTIVDGEQAMISVFDRGFLFGDSVYETLRTSGRVPVDLDAHLERLARSAAAIALELPGAELLASAVAETLEAADNDESYVRIVVTRGESDIGLATDLATHGTHIVIVRPLVLPSDADYAHGVKLAIVGVQRTSKRAMDPGVKSGNYLNNIMALHEARQDGADEALMCDRLGRIAEGASSNVFLVRDGGLLTPSLDIGLLPGITRRRVIELATADGIAVAEGTLVPGDVLSADEVFITSSIRGVLPIAEVSGHIPPSGAPGPVTGRVMELYAGHLKLQAGQ